MHYFRRLFFMFYNIWNLLFYKKIHNKSSIMPSVKTEGKKYMSIGSGVSIKRLGWLLALKIDEHEPNLTLEDGVEIGDFCHITCVRNVTIKKDAILATGVYISDNIHSHKDFTIPIKYQPVEFKSEVVIGEGSWIGEHVCIIGAKVGKNCVIGANVVLTKDVPDYTIVLPTQKVEWTYNG